MSTISIRTSTIQSIRSRCQTTHFIIIAPVTVFLLAVTCSYLVAVFSSIDLGSNSDIVANFVIWTSFSWFCKNCSCPSGCLCFIACFVQGTEPSRVPEKEVASFVAITQLFASLLIQTIFPFKFW